MYHGLSFRVHKGKLLGDVVLKVDVALFSSYWLQVPVQRRRFERVSAGLGNKKALCAISASFCDFAFIKHFHYKKEDTGYNQYEKGMLASFRLPNLELKHNEVCTENDLVESCGIVPVATRKITASEELYFDYRKAEFESSVLPEYIWKHSFFIDKILSV